MPAHRSSAQNRWQRLAAHAALRPQRRPQRQGEGAARPRDPRLRRRLWRHRARGSSMFAVAGNDHPRPPHRLAGRGRDRAARHPRPQRRDPRDRREGALAVRRAAQDHRRRRGESSCSPPCCPISTPTELRERLVLQARLRLAQARDHAEAAAGNPPARHSRHRLPRPRTSASIRTAPRSRTSSVSSTSTTRASPASRNGSTSSGLAALHMAGLATDRLQKPVELVARSARAASRCATS